MMRSLLCLMTALSVLGCGGAPTGPASTGVVQSPRGAAQTASGASTSNGEISAYSSGFMEGCERECTRTSTAALCASYCSCMNQRVTSEGQGAHVNELGLQGNDALMRDPWFQRAFSSCGADLHDRSFVQGCVSNCPGNCGAYCQCALDQIRGRMTREEGTYWFLQNLDLGVTLEGQAAINNAIQACMPLRPAQ